ncbi:uncharacterized protein, YigZ family [Paraoerskovia marina]|uniref:Uncharacterized protein, YigZ family n=1 Tax=Paraoerskovia marina TaxID=545619 RepID=A0A1H1SZR9_9CELL|nr:YigZ family protein [Paraoerskovia marina]SDS52889.1 uncharacterized protein, YigZ family [Paraoerskovia marina]
MPTPPNATLLATVAAPVSTETEVKRSRFLAHLSPVTSVDEATSVIADRRRSFWDARHHCTALVVGPSGDVQRSSDDGEPAGTAGAPLLDVLRKQHLTDVVVVVTRYFGGTLLGAGGLIRAYSGAAALAVASAHRVERRYMTRVSVAVPHAEAGRLVALLHTWAAEHGAVMGTPYYAEQAVLLLDVADAELDLLDADLAAATGGATLASRGERRVVDVP